MGRRSAPLYDAWARLFHRTGFYAPDLLRILPDRAVTRELARTGEVENDLLRPFVRLAVEVAQPPVGMKIGGEVGQVHEMVALGEESAAQGFEDPRLVGTEMIRKDQIQRLAGFRLIFIVPMRIVPGLAVGDFLCGEAEQEEVFLSRLLGHFDR